ncbi:MAG: hypothetical protein HYY64_18800 [Candidatus Rokubacteria bacterium]|nr:hypothetical protein [Candidatus Rokubacteria bacterium]
MRREEVVESRRPSWGRLIGFLVLLAGVSWALGAFAAFPLPLSAPDRAVLTIAFKHVAAFEGEGRERSKEELEKLPRHMRPVNERSRTGRRVDTVLRVELDGRRLLEKTYRPGGFRHDGPTFAYEQIPVPPGGHRLVATLRDAAGEKEERERGRRWRLDQEVEIRPRQVLLMELSEEGGLTLR